LHRVHSLQRPRAPRAPRPFPTRRSSDLAAWAGGQAVAASAPAPVAEEAPPPTSEPEPEAPAEQAPAAPAAPEAQPAPIPVAAAVDRKSTRLNSSHVKISYAVFCLKKKNR